MSKYKALYIHSQVSIHKSNLCKMFREIVHFPLPILLSLALVIFWLKQSAMQDIDLAEGKQEEVMESRYFQLSFRNVK